MKKNLKEPDVLQVIDLDVVFLFFSISIYEQTCQVSGEKDQLLTFDLSVKGSRVMNRE